MHTIDTRLTEMQAVQNAATTARGVDPVLLELGGLKWADTLSPLPLPDRFPVAPEVGR